MQKRYAIIIDNTVNNVVIWDDEQGPFPNQEGVIAVNNDWVGPGDWWEEAEQRFYRAIPNNDDVVPTVEDETV